MADNLTSMSPAQKEVYEGAINSWLSYNRKRAWNFIGKESAFGGQAPIVGSSTQPPKSSHFAAHVGFNSTGGFQDPDLTFPTAGSNSYKQAAYSGRTAYWPNMVTRSVIRNTKGDKAAFAEAMSEISMRAAQVIEIDLERVLMGDGSGTLGVVASATSASPGVITLKNPVDARKFQVGMYLNAYDARTAGATQQNFSTTGSVKLMTVTAVDLSAGTVSVTTIGTGGTQISAGDVLTKGNDQNSSDTYQGARTSTVRNEPMGLDGIVSDRDSPMETGATYGGLFGILAPADYSGNANTGGVATWASYVNRVASGSRAYADTYLQLAVSQAEVNSGFTPNVCFTSYGGDLEIWQSRQGIRRTVNDQGVTGGAAPGKKESAETGNYLEFGNSIPVVPCRFAPVSVDSAVSTQMTTSFIFVYTPKVKVKEWHKPRFLDDDGQLWRMQGRVAQFESVMEYQYETICTQRNCHAKVTDIQSQAL